MTREFTARLRVFLSKLPLRWAIGLGLAALAFVAATIHQINLVGDFRIDDAYISFSFAKNFAEGNGLVFAHGQRVEGYSNFLWVVLTGVGYFLLGTKTDPYTIARALGFAFLALGCVVTYLMARRHASRWAALAAVALVVASTDVVRATMSGLETVPYMSAVAFGFWAYLREAPTERRWSLLAFLPAALLRIDGFVPMAIVVAFEVAASIVERRFSPKQLLRWALPAVALWAVYFGIRWGYYGLVLPSTYYAKELVALNEPDRGYSQAWEFAREYGALFVLPCMFAALFGRVRREPALLLLTVFSLVLYVGIVGGDWMPFRRFFLPALPLAAVLVAWGMQAAWQQVEQAVLEVRIAVVLLAALSVGGAATYAHASSLNTALERSKQAEAAHSLNHTRDNLLGTVELMRHVVREPGDRLVTDYAGVFSVYTDAAVIDMWGLCNADIALKGGARGINPIYGKECARCYKRFDPDYFHVMVPLVRPLDAFQSVEQIIGNVFQGWAINRHIDIRRHFAAGRVVDLANQKALWFLERRRENRPLLARTPAPGIRVDYPFEP